MSQAPTISIHDNFLLGYEVQALSREITLRTEFQEKSVPERTDVLFSGVEAYRFENDSFGTILFQIEEVDIFNLLQDQWKLFEAEAKISGWPGPWAVSHQQAKDYLKSQQCRAFSIESSIGMNGWVFARSMEFISR